MKYNHRVIDKCFSGQIPLFPNNPQYGNTYVPFQQGLGVLYTPEKALMCGTIFEYLNKPYNASKRGGQI